MIRDVDIAASSIVDEVKNVIYVIVAACDASMLQCSYTANKRPVYWCN